MMRRRRAPGPSDTVMSSAEVTDRKARVTRVHRFRSGWMFLSATEADDSEPIWLHFSHVLEIDADLAGLVLRRGEYALRPMVGGEWSVFGPFADRLVDEMMDDGSIDRQHELVIARASDPGAEGHHR